MMLRGVIIAVGCLLADHATAQVNCIPMTVVTPYQTGSIQSIGYNSDTKNLVAAYRAAPVTIRAFQAVPAQIAQRFTGMTNADAFFNANVAPYYHEGLLTELHSDLCPILNENGAWIWTH